MTVENKIDKYLKEAVRDDVSNKKRYESLMNLANDLEDYGKKMYDLIEMVGFEKYTSKEISKELDRRKIELIKIRNRAMTQEFKNIVDEYISFNTDVSEKYWQNVDTSREGT